MERKQAKQTTCPSSLESTVQCSVRACATAPGCCVEVQRHPLSSLCTASASRGQASRGGWRAAASQSPATALAIDALSHQFESSVGGVTKRGRKREAMASKGKRHRHGENHAGTKKKAKTKTETKSNFASMMRVCFPFGLSFSFGFGLNVGSSSGFGLCLR